MTLDSDKNPILYGSDGWYDALTGERINRLAKENMDSKTNAAMAGVGPNKSWEQTHEDAMRVILVMGKREQALQAKLDIALKWLDKIGSFAGERQRSATETEDYYLKGIHDTDVATRKLVEMAKEEIERTV